VYQALLAVPGRDWTVGRLAEAVSQAPVETVHTGVNIPISERLMDLIPRQRAMTVRLTAEGNAVLREILDRWTAERESPGGQG
jgi:hypothetical protein